MSIITILSLSASLGIIETEQNELIVAPVLQKKIAFPVDADADDLKLLQKWSNGQFINKQVYSEKKEEHIGLSGYVMAKNPELNSTLSYAKNNPTRNQAKKDQTAEVDRYLNRSKNSYAILSFTQKGCNACLVQKPMLDRFKKSYGISIKDVDIKEHPLAQAKYGITGTPITILINREDKDAYMPISIGVATDSELKFNTYRAIRLMEGVIKPSQYYTRDRDLGKYFDPDAYKEK